MQKCLILSKCKPIPRSLIFCILNRSYILFSKHQVIPRSSLSQVGVPAEVKVTDVVASLADDLRQHVRETGVTELSLRGELADPDQLQQVSL